MKKHSTTLTFIKGENYGVVYLQEERTFLVVDEKGNPIIGGEFVNSGDAIDFAHEKYEEEKIDVRK